MNVWSEWVLEVGSTDTDLVVAAPGSAGAEPCPCHRDQTTETQTLRARGLFLVSAPSQPLHASSAAPQCHEQAPVSRNCDTLWVTLLVSLSGHQWPVWRVWPLAMCTVTRDAELRARLSNYQFSIYPMQPTQTKTRIISTFPQPRDARNKAQSTRSVLFLLMKDNDCYLSFVMKLLNISWLHAF